VFRLEYEFRYRIGLLLESDEYTRNYFGGG